MFVEDAFANMAYNYMHHFMYLILIAYITCGMLVLMFTQVQNLHMTFLCVYANFIGYFHIQLPKNSEGTLLYVAGCTHLWAGSRLSQNHTQLLQPGKDICFGYERNYWTKYLV